MWVKMFCLLAVVIVTASIETMDCSPVGGHALTCDPFRVVQAELYDYAHLAHSQVCPSIVTAYVGSIERGALFGFRGLDFGAGAELIQLRLAAWDKGIINLHLDSDANQPFVTIDIQTVNYWSGYCDFYDHQQPVSTVPTGVHDLVFTFDIPEGKPNFTNIDWFTFS